MNSLDALKNLMYLDRFMLKILKLALLFFLFPLSPLLALQKPNILWITAEDMSSSLGCYGDSDAITPNIDQFANGVFDTLMLLPLPPFVPLLGRA